MSNNLDKKFRRTGYRLENSGLVPVTYVVLVGIFKSSNHEFEHSDNQAVHMSEQDSWVPLNLFGTSQMVPVPVR